MKKEKPVCLIDLDMTVVDMIKTWIRKYNKITGENIIEDDIIHYELRKFVKRPKVLDKLLASRDFFFYMEPIEGAVEYFTKLMKIADVVVCTQPPRSASLFAVRDKRDWLKKYFPLFEQTNVIFTHRKDLIVGDVLFDDAPHHLKTWKKRNPKAITAKIEYLYNKNCESDWTFKKETAWKEFYEKIASGI